MSYSRILVLSALLGSLAVPSLSPAQSQPASDPQALTLAAQAITALTGGTSISDVTLTGNATWIAGSDNETGPATLMAKGSTESRVDLNLTGGLRSDIRNDTAGYPQGASVIGSGSQQAWALHNCWINASWFFPALSFLATPSDLNLVFSYVGQESRNGTSVQHFQIYRYLAGQKTAVISLTQQLSESTSIWTRILCYQSALTSTPTQTATHQPTWRWRSIFQTTDRRTASRCRSALKNSCKAVLLWMSPSRVPSSIQGFWAEPFGGSCDSPEVNVVQSNLSDSASGLADR